ncbi:unnamed protein product [Coffea canephora]|uniref:RING-type domain-containing protein n=1 Tax=Coffea canephora TaxID=49390 RepID=A0A068UY03_COFCA|nr:unnamed protein product [Coffea canephora]
MWQNKPQKSSFGDSIKALEADIQHANYLAAALPRDSGQGCFQMKVCVAAFSDRVDGHGLPAKVFRPLSHTCTCGWYAKDILSSQERRASLREFYAVIYPSLKQLEGALKELMEDRYRRAQCSDILSDEETEATHKGPERDDECGTCLETGSQVVLPNCGHSMCISCYQDWYLLVRSPSCPFCRGSSKRVSSGDLWILMGNRDVADTITLAKENLRQFYLYMEKLPLPVTVPDNGYLSFDYMV